MQFPRRSPPRAMAAGVAFLSTSSFSLVRRSRFLPPASASACCLIPRCRARLRLSRQVAIGSDVSAEEDAAARKVGKRVRVTAPVRVHHVAKAPGLELRGREGVFKQYVGVWKGKRITANLPFKVEFELKLDGLDKPAMFLTHLREEEFEIVGED